MHRKVNHTKIFLFILLPMLLVIVVFSFLYKGQAFSENEYVVPENISLTLLFTGDIFLDRHIDGLSQKSELSYSYPFQGLKTLERENYDAWVGNLECPVTDVQSTKQEKEKYLKFSCKKEYLPELKKYFDIVSLANNHTDNMGKKGVEETRKHLAEANIKYFGDPDSSQTKEVCKIVYIKKFPFAFCGFNGVYKLPTDKDIEIVKRYSKHFVTFVMPHQGEEYKFVSNSYQKKVYRKLIENGADVVMGSHPHVIEEVEDYKGKKIFYSLGNFIFDQSWAKTREHMTVKTEINFPDYKYNYGDLTCDNISSLECLEKAEKLGIQKPVFEMNFTPIYTHSGLDFITTKK